MESKQPELKLTEDQIADFREAFSFFDKDSDGFVDTSQLGLLIRSLNQNPTNAEIAEYMLEVDQDGIGKFDFPEFISLLARKFKEVDGEEELLEAFKVFDKSATGFIMGQELSITLKALGEKLSDEEMDELIQLADTEKTSQINYADFVKLITSSYIN